MKKHFYPACFYKEQDGRYSVIFPDFGGATYGNDFQDAMEMAEDYLGGTIMDCLDDKEPLPTPSDIQSLKADEYPNGFVTMVGVDVEQYRQRVRSIKKTLTIPGWLNDAAIEQHINFSQVLQEALKARLGL